MISSILRTTFIGALAVAMPAFADPALSLVPSTQNVSVGNSFSVDLRIDGLGDGVAPSVGTYDLNVSFDSMLVSFDTATYGTGLDVWGLGSLQATTPGSGSVNLFELSFDTPEDLNLYQPAGFKLATLTFQALSGGTSPLSLSLNAFGDADGVSLPATLQNSSVTVTAVPEPETYVMMLAGLAVLSAVARRRSSRLALS